jgi:hypothetical protein
MTSQTLTKRELAQRLLEELFVGRDRITIAEAVAAGVERGVSRRTLVRACREAGIREVHNGPYGGFWEKPGKAGTYNG